MARWTDLATWRGPTPNQSGPMVEQRGVVVHIAEGSFEGTISWCKNPASNVSAHFIVATDGRIAQMVDTDVTAWTQRDGNGHWLSIENEGHTPGALTAAQVDANAAILARAHQVYGVPLQLATSPSGRGLGHHSMGAESGVNWGHSQCPGPAIKAQKPQILARAIEMVGGEDMSAEAENFLRALRDGVPKVDGHVNCPVQWEIDRQAREVALDARLTRIEQALAALAEAGGPQVAAVRAAVRAELDATRLSGA